MAAKRDTDGMSADEQAIRDLVATWMEASKRNDIATLLDLMADDILFLVPGRPPFGKAAFAAASEGMANVEIEGMADIQEIEVMGDRAFLRNYLAVRITQPGGGASRHHAGPYPLNLAQGCGWVLAARARRQSRDAPGDRCGWSHRLGLYPVAVGAASRQSETKILATSARYPLAGFRVRKYDSVIK